MKTLLIVHHSRTGGARQMADAAAAGARAADDVRVRSIGAADATGEDLLSADGYLFAAPENLASLSGEMKEFFDRTYYAVLERLNGRPYGMLICAGSDGTGAVRQLTRIATGWRLRQIAEPIIVITNAQTPESILAPKSIPPTELQSCFDLGEAIATGLALGVF